MATLSPEHQDVRGRPPISSLSTFLTAAVAATAAAAVLAAFPVSVFAGKAPRWTALQWAQVVVGAGAVFWVGLGTVLQWAMRLWRGKRHLRDTVVVNPRHEIPSFQYHVDAEDIELRVRGDLQSTSDHGGPLLATPFAMYEWRRGQGLKPVIIIPALFWKRFSGHIEELQAVLAHEIAHFRQRDILLLYGAQDIARAALALLAISTALSLASSIRADAERDGFEWVVVQASIIGKAYLWTCLLATIASIPLLGRLVIWREALADRYAESVSAPGALERAEALVQAGEAREDGAGDRPTSLQRRQAHSLTGLQVFFAGAAASVVGGYVVGGLLALIAAITGVGGLGEIAVHPISEVAHGAWTTLAPLFGLLSLLIDPGAPDRLGAALARRGMLFCIGWTVGWLLGQTLPLLLVSIAMPAGYDYVFRHYPGRLLLSETVSAMSTSAAVISLALASCWCAWRSGKIWMASLPPIVWIAVAAVEVRVFPFVAGLAATAATIGALVGVGCWGGGRRMSLAGAMPALGALLLAATIGWLGLGGINHIAACLGEAARWREQEGDASTALTSYRATAGYARFHAGPHLDLARALVRTNDLAGATEAAERAARAPYGSAWSQVFEARVLAAEVRLALRSPSDLQIAETLFEEAESMWRQNSRLPRELVASMLYNRACLGALRGRPAVFSLARLLEASALVPRMAKDALLDEDLRALRLSEAEPPDIRVITILKANRNVTAPDLEMLVRDGKISDEQLGRVVAHIGRGQS